MKKVLIVGNGGREHALAWKLAQSPDVSELYVAPGNGGTSPWNVPVPVSDIPGLVQFALEKQIDLTVIGPEEPLTLGIVDKFEKAGLRIFGPNAAAARIEGSKAFAKAVMEEAGVPTAKWRSFTNGEEAKDYVRKLGAPCVIKADGLAAGKGVIVAGDLETALQAVDDMMAGSMGAAGQKLVVEEFLTGPEISLLCFVDGRTARPMVAAQDHKRALDGDQGLNTGGMGTISPPEGWTPELEDRVMQDIVYPTLKEMARLGSPFRGVLFCGLMLTPDGPKVIEFNARFGDPETQVVLPRLKTDLLSILWACTEGTLNQVPIAWSEEGAVCVVMSSPGYPGAYVRGIELGLPEKTEDAGFIFHAGTQEKDGNIVSSGGRVLGVTAWGGDLSSAREKAYALVEKVNFPGAHYRRDIGKVNLAKE